MDDKFVPTIEKAPINFKRIFDDKLESIKPLSTSDSEWEAHGLDEVGINSVKRKAPCIIFYSKRDIDLGYNIWLEDSRDCDRRYPHDDVIDSFKKFQKENKITIDYGNFSGFIIEDKEGKKYLLFLDNVAEYKKEDVIDQESRRYLIDLSRDYGIEKIIGSFKYEIKETSENPTSGAFSYTVSTGFKFENILDENILANIRENSYLKSFAEKYKMTNTQFMRFRIRAISGRKAYEKEKVDEGVRYLINLDDLAKEVIAQDKEEGYL